MPATGVFGTTVARRTIAVTIEELERVRAHTRFLTDCVEIDMRALASGDPEHFGRAVIQELGLSEYVGTLAKILAQVTRPAEDVTV